MKKQQLKSLDRRLSLFLRELLEPMGRSERRHWARVYLQGLLLDGDRKSIGPIAERIPPDTQALRQFVGQSPWAVHDIQRRLARKIVDLFSNAEVWIVDETSFPKDAVQVEPATVVWRQIPMLSRRRLKGLDGPENILLWQRCLNPKI